MVEALIKELDDKMNKAIEVVEHELNTLRTGRASVHMLDGVKVSIYGTENSINQLATVSTPDASTIQIQPWDKNALGAIEKAILQANIGITPSNDGKLVRLNVPQLTEQTRKDMVKQAHKISEEGRVAVRNVRRHVIDEVKKLEKDHALSEDDSRRRQEQIQKKTDDFIKKIDGLLAAKEKEIMTV
jgi:ribosome recycling factor